MGVLAVQMKQPVAGLPYFITALNADPARRQYWLNYIDALIQAGQVEDARQILALAWQHGLEGDEVEALAVCLEGGAQAQNNQMQKISILLRNRTICLRPTQTPQKQPESPQSSRNRYTGGSV